MHITHDDLILMAVTYRRNVGAELSSIRGYLTIREEEKHSTKEDKDALARLEQMGKVIKVGTRWFLNAETYKQAKGPSVAPEWQAEDAWILLALLYNRTKEECRLEHIIATADAINHSILTIDEIYGALNRLEAGRLIRPKDEVFTLTELAIDLFTKVETACGKNALKQLDCLRRILDCPCCGIRLRSVHWRVKVDDRQLKKAIQTHYKMMEARL